MEYSSFWEVVSNIYRYMYLITDLTSVVVTRSSTSFRSSSLFPPLITSSTIIPDMYGLIIVRLDVKVRSISAIIRFFRYFFKNEKNHCIAVINKMSSPFS